MQSLSFFLRSPAKQLLASLWFSSSPFSPAFVRCRRSKDGWGRRKRARFFFYPTKARKGTKVHESQRRSERSTLSCTLTVAVNWLCVYQRTPSVRVSELLLAPRKLQRLRFAPILVPLTFETFKVDEPTSELRILTTKKFFSFSHLDSASIKSLFIQRTGRKTEKISFFGFDSYL